MKKMKKYVLLSLGMCMLLAFSSCKSTKESAYKKAYEKAKQQELAETQQPVTPVEEVAPVVPATPKVVESVPMDIRQEKVTVVSGDNGLKDFSVVAGSFGVKANADNLKVYLDKEGYNAIVVFNAEAAMYRVIVASFAERASADAARDAFKAKYPARKDFQGAWLLYRMD